MNQKKKLTPHYRPRLAASVETIEIEGIGPSLRHRDDARYIRISASSQMLLAHMDGERSVAELRNVVAEQSGLAVSEQAILKFVTTLGEQGMLDDVELATERAAKPQKLLHLKFRLFHSERVLQTVSNLLGRLPRLLTVPAVAALIFWGIVSPIVLIVSGVISVHFRWSAIPVAAYLLIPLYLLIEVSLHEMAHAVAMTMQGGRVREFGLGLRYFLIPYTYTNTTDAYSLSRRARIIVSLAGPMVDVVLVGLNSLALLLLPEQSLFHHLLPVMIAIELTILLWNCSPFLPFDGYLILADVLNEPSLRPRGFAYLASLPRRILRGEKAAYSRKQQAVYLAYGALSALYLFSFFAYNMYFAIASNPMLRTQLLLAHPHWAKYFS